MEIQENETQWRVRWTDPSGERTRTGSEADVRRAAVRQAEWSPVVESRTITVGEWEVPNG